MGDLSKFTEGSKKWFDGMSQAFVDMLGTAIITIPAKVGDAILGLAPAIAAAIGAELAKIPGMITGSLGLTGTTSGTNLHTGVGTSVTPGTHSAPTALAPGKQSSLTIHQKINFDGRQIAQEH